MRYTKRISPEAHNDIAQIKEYIAKDKPAVAARVAIGIYDCFDMLVDNPYAGGDLGARRGIKTDYRFFIVAPHIVFYKVTASSIDIYRVLDTRMDYLSILGLK